MNHCSQQRGAHLAVRDIARWESVMEARHAALAGQFDIHHATCSRRQ
jgi:hypothetical protein